MDRLLTTREFAELINIPERTLRNKMFDGSWTIQPVRIGRSLRWRESDLDKIVSGEIVIPSTVSDSKAVSGEPVT